MRIARCPRRAGAYSPGSRTEWIGTSRSTARAVRLLVRGDLDGAVAELADFCGLTPAEWERVTRAEQGR
jgi:hypothetical protein